MNQNNNLASHTVRTQNLNLNMQFLTQSNATGINGFYFIMQPIAPNVN